MMKLLNLVVLLVCVFGGINLSNGEKLNCLFRNQLIFTLKYTCFVDYTLNNNMIINGHLGVHMDDNDVNVIWIQDKKTKTLPANLGLLFNKLTHFVVWADLVEIKSEDFYGMQNLNYLNFLGNKITSLPSDVFSTLPKLNILFLAWNNIEELPKNLFSNNLNLEKIILNGNKIEFISNGLFDGLTKLNVVNFLENTCVNKNYYGTKDIMQLKRDMKQNCKILNNNSAAIAQNQNTFQQQIIQDLEDQLFVANNELRKIRANHQNLENHLIAANNELRNNVAFQQYLEYQLYLANNELRNIEANRQNPGKFSLTCQFEKNNDHYSCLTHDLVIKYKEMKLNEVIGSHVWSKSNTDVTQLMMSNSSMLYWSNDIFKTFPAVKILMIYNAELTQLSKGDFNSARNLRTIEVHGNTIRVLDNHVFQGAEQLTQIEMESNQIERISVKTFKRLNRLKLLSLKDNLITEIQPGSFSDLINLKTLILSTNKLKSMDGKLLQFNVKLITLVVDNNNLNDIGEDILNYSTEFTTVDFSDNKCIDEKTKCIDEKTKCKEEIQNLVYEIKIRCNYRGKNDYLSSATNILI